MPPKVASKPKVKSSSDHVTYQDMIIDAIVTLKERNGSSRVALKKYIKANNQNLVDGKMFDSLFNRALKSGVEKGVFAQPRGSSGGTKLAKKEPKPSSSKLVAKPIEAKEPEKKAVVKKSAPKKIASEPVKEKAKEKVVRESEDEDEEEEEVAPKPKASRSTKAKAPSKPKRASKETPVKEAPVVVHRTKSGRIIKSTATPTKTVTPNKATSKSKDKS